MTLDHNRMSGPSLHSHCLAQTNQFKAEIYTTHRSLLTTELQGGRGKIFYHQAKVKSYKP